MLFHHYCLSCILVREGSYRPVNSPTSLFARFPFVALCDAACRSAF